MKKSVLFLLMLIAFSYGEKYVLKEVNGSYKIAKEMQDNSDNECYLEIEKQKDYMMIAGLTFCNHFFGGTTNSRLDIGATTMMICSPKDMESEEKILSILNNANIEMSNNFVVFKNKNGSLMFIKE